MGTRIWGVVALLLGMLGASTGLAADLSLVPSVNVRTEFTSNLNNDFKNPISDCISTLAYATEYNYTTETSQLQGILGLKGMHYFRESSADHIDQNYQINAQYRPAPRWNLSLRSAFITDSSLQEELSTSGLIMTRTPRQSIQMGPAVTYNLTERLAATVNYNFNQVNYQDPQFRNYASQQVGLTLNYPLKNEKTVLVSNFLVRETTYPGTDKYRSFGTSLGATHRFRENWDLNLMVGVNISFMDFQTQVVQTSQSFLTIPTQTRFKETKLSPSINVSTTRRWTNLSLTAGLSRDESPSAYGSISELYRAYGGANYQFSERLSGSLTGGCYLSNQASQQNNLGNGYFDISPQLNWRITEKLTASPGYRFSLRNDITNDRSATTQVVWLMLTYSYPIHYQR